MADKARHIVACGGFQGDEPLRDYLLELCDVTRPRVCFLATPTGDDGWSIGGWRQHGEYARDLARTRCRPRSP